MSELLRKLEERAKKKPVPKRPMPKPKRPLIALAELIVKRERPFLEVMKSLRQRQHTLPQKPKLEASEKNPFIV